MILKLVLLFKVNLSVSYFYMNFMLNNRQNNIWCEVFWTFILLSESKYPTWRSKQELLDVTPSLPNWHRIIGKIFWTTCFAASYCEFCYFGSLKFSILYSVFNNCSNRFLTAFIYSMNSSFTSFLFIYMITYFNHILKWYSTIFNLSSRFSQFADLLPRSLLYYLTIFLLVRLSDAFIPIHIGLDQQISLCIYIYVRWSIIVLHS